METQKAIQGHYRGKIFESENIDKSLLLTATQLCSSSFSEKHILSLGECSKEFNRVVTSQIGIDKQGHILRKCIKENNHIKLEKYIELFNFDINSFVRCKYRPDDNNSGTYTETLLYYAITAKANTEIFRLLINKTTNMNSVGCINYRGGYKIIKKFMLSNLINKYELMELFLENKIWDINEAIDNSGVTPLHIAVRHYYQPELVKFLLDHGANKNKRDSDGISSLEDGRRFIQEYNRTDMVIYNILLKILKYMEEY